MKTFVIAWDIIGDAISMKKIQADNEEEALQQAFPDYYSDYKEHRKHPEESFENFRDWMYGMCEVDIEILEV